VKLDNGQPLVTLTLFELRLSVDAAVSMETTLLRNAAAAAAATVRYGCPTRLPISAIAGLASRHGLANAKRV